MPNNLILILGDQLFPSHPNLPKNTPIFMREDHQLITQPKIHQQKITLFLSAMRHHAESLQSQDHSVHYQKYNPNDSQTYPQALTQHCKENNIQTVYTYQIHDQPFAIAIQNELADNNIKLSTIPSQSFLTPREDWETYRDETNRLLMADFYIRQRKRLNILITKDQQPVGDQWSFDEDNRKPFPKSKTPPHVPRFSQDDTTKTVINVVKKYFNNHPGNAEDFDWPVTTKEAKKALNDFIQDRLHNFGPYEDAVAKDHPYLYHSLISPLLNTGLITPTQVIKAIQNQDAPIQSKEGFIRQVIGWREFIYHVYLDYQDTQDHLKNHLNHTKKLKPCWYNATTGLPPIDHSIKNLNQRAWLHHIPRLMLLGSPMLMAGIHPDEVNRWFTEMFIDAADWVMIPNVYGMSQYADGGTFATKPYISGSSYILKMTDFPKGDWCDIWDGLYWNFIDQNKRSLSQNHRMSMMIRQLEKLKPERRDKIFTAAHNWINQVTS